MQKRPVIFENAIIKKLKSRKQRILKHRFFLFLKSLIAILETKRNNATFIFLPKKKDPKFTLLHKIYFNANVSIVNVFIIFFLSPLYPFKVVREYKRR